MTNASERLEMGDISLNFIHSIIGLRANSVHLFGVIHSNTNSASQVSSQPFFEVKGRFPITCFADC
jgi:hypothetical protein